MQLREKLYFQFLESRGGAFPKHYRQLNLCDSRREYDRDARASVAAIVQHCASAVPYYSRLLQDDPFIYNADPFEAIRQLPVLTKDLVRNNWEDLKSTDLNTRRHYINTSGGSTGEPIRFIQDQHYADRAGAIAAVFSMWFGCGPTDTEIRLWGSERDVLQGSYGWRASIVNRLTRTRYLNAFRMTPERMREFIDVLNRSRPNVITAYTQAIYELACFAEREGIRVIPQRVIMTSAGTLYQFMRSKIEAVFGCCVVNRYGSREVGAIACQCEAGEGLHVAPWSCWVEIVDDQYRPVPDGEEGNIIVTALTNFAMPLLRYHIGDRGALSTERCSCGRSGQILARVSGRNVDAFRKADGTLIDGEYFTHLLYFRNWVHKFQVVQRAYEHVEFRIVGVEAECPRSDMDEITQKTRILLGDRCRISFEFLNDISPSIGGKFRYTISEVTH